MWWTAVLQDGAQARLLAYRPVTHLVTQGCSPPSQFSGAPWCPSSLVCIARGLQSLGSHLIARLNQTSCLLLRGRAALQMAQAPAPRKRNYCGPHRGGDAGGTPGWDIWTRRSSLPPSPFSLPPPSTLDPYPLPSFSLFLLSLSLPLSSPSLPLCNAHAQRVTLIAIHSDLAGVAAPVPPGPLPPTCSLCSNVLSWDHAPTGGY